MKRNNRCTSSLLSNASTIKTSRSFSSPHATGMSTFIVLLLLSIGVFDVQSVVYNVTNRTTNWQSILTSLKPGDIVNFYRGTYTTGGNGFLQWTLNGTVNQPIIIQAAPNEPRPIIRCPQTGAGAQNVLNVQGSNFLIKGLGFTQGSRGVRVGPAGKCFDVRYDVTVNLVSLATRNATFDNIFIFNVTGTGFSANDAGNEYVNITLRNSEIANTNALGEIIDSDSIDLREIGFHSF